jgi:cytochrome c-type biogenesis protein CcmH/NrfG
LATSLARGLHVRDPFKELAEQRARPIVGPALAPRPGLTLPALQPGAPPRDAAYFLELGRTCAAMGELVNAVAALRHATGLEPGLRPAWEKLGDVLMRLRDNEGAKAAHATAHALPAPAPARPERKNAARLESEAQAWAKRLAEGNPEASGPMLRAHLRTEPTDVAALRLLAQIGSRKKLFAQAEGLLARALELAPHHIPLRFEYAHILFSQVKNTAALPVIEALVEEEPGNPAHSMLLAMCLANLGEFDRSLALYERLMDEMVKQPELLTHYAYTLRYAGRRADSVAVARRALALAPRTGVPWWCLADMKNEAFSDADLAAMRRQLEDDAMPALERYHLQYALGKALEQQGAFAESFTHYAKGAALRRAEISYSADGNTQEMARHRAFFTEFRLAAGAAHGHPDPAPIFVVGLPRVGSTLVEQILASHSAVEGTQELREISEISNDIGLYFGMGAGSQYPERLAGFSPEQIAAYGARYIANTRMFRRTDRPFYIDKMPGNWVFTGLIHTILPNAKIIDVRRHPMATGFSVFKQLFSTGADYSYDLTEIGRYYSDYVKTMAHFDQMLPGRVHRVSYETLVADTEAEIRAMLEYCELPFEPACLRFWETRRAVATPSVEQVRRPIFKDAVEQWRNYAPWLDKLEQALDFSA